MADRIQEENEIEMTKTNRSASVPAVEPVNKNEETKKLIKSQTIEKNEETKKLIKSQTIDSGKSTGTGKKPPAKNTKKRKKKAAKGIDLSCRSLIFALIVRILFAFHASIAFWRVRVIVGTLVEVGMKEWYTYINLGGIGLLFLETAFTLLYRGGRDYKWFCPCVFFYLVSIIPSMIMLEYAGYHNDPDCSGVDRNRRDIFYNRFARDVNVTNSTGFLSLPESITFINITEMATTTTPAPTTTTSTTTTTTTTKLFAIGRVPDKVLDVFDDVKTDGVNVITDITNIAGHTFNNIKEKVESFAGNNETWLLGLHQVLLFFLVIGRWLLPRGGISREQLSQLLLVFIGTGADILEFVSETIEDDTDKEQKCRPVLRYMIWSVWTWSLLQFTLVLTASAAKKRNIATTSDQTKADFKKSTESCRCTCCHGYFANPDVWGMSLTLILQDIPFLVARCYFIFKLSIQSQMMYFFALKNLLVVFLQIYRLVVLWGSSRS